MDCSKKLYLAVIVLEKVIFCVLICIFRITGEEIHRRFGSGTDGLHQYHQRQTLRAGAERLHDLQGACLRPGDSWWNLVAGHG